MKLFEFENVVSGQKGNVLDLGGMWSKILGVVVMFLVIATGQNLAKKLTKAVPMLDTSVERLTVNEPVKLAGTLKRVV